MASNAVNHRPGRAARAIHRLFSSRELVGGGAPFNVNPVFEFGEAWQGFSWNFSWPPALGVIDTIEAYLGRFSDHR